MTGVCKKMWPDFPKSKSTPPDHSGGDKKNITDDVLDITTGVTTRSLRGEGEHGGNDTTWSVTKVCPRRVKSCLEATRRVFGG